MIFISKMEGEYEEIIEWYEIVFELISSVKVGVMGGIVGEFMGQIRSEYPFWDLYQERIFVTKEVQDGPQYTRRI